MPTHGPKGDPHMTKKPRAKKPARSRARFDRALKLATEDNEADKKRGPRSALRNVRATGSY